MKIRAGAQITLSRLKAVASFFKSKRRKSIVVIRGRQEISLDLRSVDEFEFLSGDMLRIVPSDVGVLKTPDGCCHLQRTDGGAIRVPGAYTTISYRHYLIPEHLMMLTGAGAETWEAIGKKHVANYQQFMGLGSEMSFLEIGCGIGRDAFQLVDVLGNGRYEGIDVTRDSILWCQRNISRDHPNFTFHHFDANHELYNPLGKKSSLDFELPAANRSIDRIALGSVFTHLFEQEVVHYMKEIARVLKPDGLAYATFFLYSEETIAATRKNNLTPNNLMFEHPYDDGCFINDAAYPTGAVAYTDDAMQRMISKAGLQLARPYLKGWWSGLHAEADDGQEVAILTPARRTDRA